MRIPSMLLNQTVILKAYIGTDSRGQQVYGTIDTLDSDSIVSFDEESGEYVIRCRFESTVSSDRQGQRETKDFTARMFVNGSNIPAQSRVIYEGKKYTVADCIQQYAMRGLSHIEVRLQ